MSDSFFAVDQTAPNVEQKVRVTTRSAVGRLHLSDLTQECLRQVKSVNSDVTIRISAFLKGLRHGSAPIGRIL